MKITIETQPYNQRRYGRPWVARVDFSRKASGEFTFGQWAGEPGNAGLLVIEANLGDVIATGQRDTRGRQDPPEFFVVGRPTENLNPEDYELHQVSRVTAYKHFVALAKELEADKTPEEAAIDNSVAITVTEGRECAPGQKTLVITCGPGVAFNSNSRMEFTPESAQVLANALNVVLSARKGQA